MNRLLFVFLFVLLLTLVACGSESGQSAGETGQGDALIGEQVFNTGASPACRSCHSLEAGQRLAGPSLAGPSLAGLATRAAASGKPADDFIRQEILNPNAVIAQGFAANMMPATYGSQLTPQQIDDLAAFLLTLE